MVHLPALTLKFIDFTKTMREKASNANNKTADSCNKAVKHPFFSGVDFHCCALKSQII